MPKIRPAQRFWRTHQQSTCRDQWCESGMRQKDPNTSAIHEIKKILENHAFLIGYLNEAASGWRRKKLDPGEEPAYKASWTGLQSVLNRHPDQGLQEITKVYAGTRTRPPKKNGVLAAIYQVFTFAPWKWAHFQNTYKNPTCQFLNRHGQKRGLTGFMTVVFSF